jgi:hypothetical protein
MLRFDGEFFMPIMIFAIPIIAITGGIAMGIIRTMGRQRMMELHQRERIAAIERGVDVSKLPPPVLPADDWDDHGTPRAPKHRAQGLLIGGIITLFSGIGITVFLHFVTEESGAWAVGIIPAMVGAGLLLSSFLIWPRNGGDPHRGTP